MYAISKSFHTANHHAQADRYLPAGPFHEQKTRGGRAMIRGLLEKSAKVFRTGSPGPRISQEVSEQERRLIDLSVLPAREALAALDTGLRGLSSEEAEKRLDEYGPNELSHTRRMGFWARHPPEVQESSGRSAIDHCLDFRRYRRDQIGDYRERDGFPERRALLYTGSAFHQHRRDARKACSVTNSGFARLRGKGNPHIGSCAGRHRPHACRLNRSG